MSLSPPTSSHFVLRFKLFSFLFKPSGYGHLVEERGQPGRFKHTYSEVHVVLVKKLRKKLELVI